MAFEGLTSKAADASSSRNDNILKITLKSCLYYRPTKRSASLLVDMNFKIRPGCLSATRYVLLSLSTVISGESSGHNQS